ncbi:MAG: hypothetical protein AAFX09_11665 [Pseudomonadota bacterium]
MKAFSLPICFSAAALLLAACGGQDQAEPAHEAASEAAPASQPVVATPRGTGEDTLQDRGVAPNWTEGADIRTTYLAPIARRTCEAIDTGDWAETLPAGSAFASRGADARVLIAIADPDGSRTSLAVSTPELEPDVRVAFDSAVAEFMRHNLRAEDDRAGAGMHRGRDGRACIVQTDPEVIETLRTAIDAAQALSMIEQLTGGG